MLTLITTTMSGIVIHEMDFNEDFLFSTLSNHNKTTCKLIVLMSHFLFTTTIFQILPQLIGFSLFYVLFCFKT